jgi:hypothetical protein
VSGWFYLHEKGFNSHNYNKYCFVGLLRISRFAKQLFEYCYLFVYHPARSFNLDGVSHSKATYES